jgi:phytoene synthase
VTTAAESTAASEQITQRSGSNLALAFVVLPPEKRTAMTALYAFCREVDDVADEETVPPAERRERLAAWREDIRRACEGGQPQFVVNRELQPFVVKYRLPFDLFDELIRGVEMDLDQNRYPDTESVDRYCYRVASVVGLLSIEIFGYSDPQCRAYAEALGKALQWTNILRDIGNDAGRGRVYVSEAELREFGVTPEEILELKDSDRFRRLAAAVGKRARDYFIKARTCLPSGDRRSMVAAELMGTVYWRLLLKIEENGYAVLTKEPIRLSRFQKISLILRAWLRVKTGIPFASYG